MQVTGLSISLLALTLIAGCASKPPSSIDKLPADNPSLNRVRMDIDSHVGREVRWGGVISSVDIQKRTVSIKPHKQERALTLTFSQPAGREQIKTSKKAAKALGKKKLLLEELSEGAKVQVQYYPVLGQVMELVVDAS